MRREQQVAGQKVADQKVVDPEVVEQERYPDAREIQLEPRGHTMIMNLPEPQFVAMPRSDRLAEDQEQDQEAIEQETHLGQGDLTKTDLAIWDVKQVSPEAWGESENRKSSTRRMANMVAFKTVLRQILVCYGLPNSKDTSTNPKALRKRMFQIDFNTHFDYRRTIKLRVA